LNPAAMFTHCFCHSVNRAVINTVCNKNNRYARNFFGTIELLYAFVEGSALRHAYFVERQFENAGTRLHLKGLSETRWNCRASSLQRLQQKGVLRAILDTIEHVGDTTSDGTARGKAIGLLTTIQNFEFVVCLCSLAPVLALINTVSEYLQQESIDLLQAHNLIASLKLEMMAMRTDDKWQQTLKAAIDLGNTIGIDPNFREERRKKVPKRIDDGGGSETSSVSSSENLKINLYFITLDQILSQLRERFPPELCEFAYLQPLHMQVSQPLHLA
jgi:hypothetical protein